VAKVGSTSDESREPGVGAAAGNLVARLSELMGRLARSGQALARSEWFQRGKNTVLGAGLVVGAVLAGAFFGAFVLFGCGILGLSNPIGAWLVSLIVCLALVATTGVLAMLGRKEAGQAVSPLLLGVTTNVKEDRRATREVWR